MRDKILEIVYGSLEDLRAEQGIEVLESLSPQTRLFGDKSGIDSTALVALIVEIEERLDEEFDLGVALADERAMSRSTSPFRRVETLVDHIEQCLNEARTENG